MLDASGRPPAIFVPYMRDCIQPDGNCGCPRASVPPAFINTADAAAHASVSLLIPARYLSSAARGSMRAAPFGLSGPLSVSMGASGVTVACRSPKPCGVGSNPAALRQSSGLPECSGSCCLSLPSAPQLWLSFWRASFPRPSGLSVSQGGLRRSPSGMRPEGGALLPVSGGMGLSVSGSVGIARWSSASLRYRATRTSPFGEGCSAGAPTSWL